MTHKIFGRVMAAAALALTAFALPSLAQPTPRTGQTAPVPVTQMTPIPTASPAPTLSPLPTFSPMPSR